jgi:hypothetical protein
VSALSSTAEPPAAVDSGEDRGGHRDQQHPEEQTDADGCLGGARAEIGHTGQTAPSSALEVKGPI